MMKGFLVPVLWLIIGCLVGLLIGIGIWSLIQNRKPDMPDSVKRNDPAKIESALPNTEDPAVSPANSGSAPAVEQTHAGERNSESGKKTASDQESSSDPVSRGTDPDSNAPDEQTGIPSQGDPAEQEKPSANHSDPRNPVPAHPQGTSKESPDSTEKADPAPPLMIEEENTKFISIRAKIIALLECWQKGNFIKNDPEDYHPLLNQGREAARSIEEKADILHQEQAFKNALEKITANRVRTFQTQTEDLQRRFNAVNAQKTGAPDQIRKDLDPLLAEARELAGIEVPELLSERKKIRDLILDLDLYMQKNEKVLSDLVKWDSLNGEKEIRIRMQEFVKKYPKTPWGIDFVSVLADWDRFSQLEIWNQFIKVNGEHLDRFAPAPEYASAAIHFLRETKGKLDFLPEWKILMKRSPVLIKNMENRDIQKPVRDLFENASSRDLWVYHPTKEDWVYLSEEPRPGTNYYIADLFNKINTIEIPGAEISSIRPAVQVEFFKDLSSTVQSIPDKSKFDNAGKWYSDWCTVVEKLRKNEDLDPLVRFMFLKDVCTFLSQGDSFFQRRLAAWLRVLNTSPFNSHLDWFDVKNPKTAAWRKNAEQLLGFLKSDELEAVKSTQELDASIPSCARIYRRIGWLDRDREGNWMIRGRAESCPDGELLVLRKGSEKGEYDFLRIGSLENDLKILSIASSELKRGMQVVCAYKLR
ncbi:MAG: hypothetical protein Q4G69_02775 [Planctomycetia bacterium]|nr:hypothetical protein [Planctomycetia bacterium]